MNKSSKHQLRYVICATLLITLTQCAKKPDRWKAWLYPDRNDLTHSVEMGSFSTFEQCQAASIEGLRTMNLQESGDYECGLNCRFDTSMGINVCKETRK